MTDVAQFHNLSHLFISLIGAIVLLAIYRNIRKRFGSLLAEDESQKRVDRGLIYLSLAMLVWVVSGFDSYLAYHFNFQTSPFQVLIISLLSIANNFFLLLALFYFQYAPSFVYESKKGGRVILSIIILVTLLTLGAALADKPMIYFGLSLKALPDLLLSALISFLLIISLYRTFLHRGLPVVAVISSIVVMLMLASQLPEVFLFLKNDFAVYLLKIVSKTSLIFIFLVLATTWVIQLANTPRPTEMRIHFLDWSLIKLTIPSKNIEDQTVDFSSKTTQFSNLLKFAIRRKYGAAEMQPMVVGAAGEIKNQTYLTRILENINEILNQSPENALERKDLFTFLGEGKYRIRMLPQDIFIDDALLSEFAANAKNPQYQSILDQTSSGYKK
ncbi:hypothetical protein Oweho_1883 [Owenweeksia hongkongensis DSM 17368]|uniref:Uncharacterized protein n=1 Tax=Owenweeksia hongkongensis (strain DSM 17368 / CIP 108786 / JCM 12287 / NRRL B-23963 / UST20020801) TaxID=926562 RepID=G8R1T6_OWEHD|nr:hypothetical protein [Owenweeksia hongkongensis]AEV32862.1 hypothetical protein Oweho_1883 [Owenweeksia hongkongensis DSM 17368]